MSTSSAKQTGAWGRRWRRSEPLRRRLALGAAVSSVGGCGLALLDASYARRGHEHPPSLLSVTATDAGLIVPLALVLGLLVGLGSWFMHPRAEPSISGMWTRLREAGAGRPADVAAFAPLAALGVFVWATLSAQLARDLLALEASPLLCGAAIAAASLCCAAITGLVVLGLTPLLRRRLAAWSSGWRRLVDPGVTLSLALLLIVALISYGAMQGSVSGEGGVLGIYGILKRGELDLRMPGMLLLLALAAYLAPPLLRWVKPYQAALIALLPLALTLRAGSVLNHQDDLARLIERGAPLAARPLAQLKKLTDRDHDGASPWFGGGDCDDGNAAIGPAADDVPDNGIDEDCSGSDLSLKGIATAQPTAPKRPGDKSLAPENGNVILISIDTLRYDVGYAGYKRPTTPNLDALASRSVIYERAYALASYTGKSIGPMMIGKYGSETHRNWGHFNTFSPQDTFVQQRMQGAGIHTISVQGHRYFGKWGACGKTPEGCGLERGWDELDLSAAPAEGAKWATDVTVTSDKITDAAIALLDKRPADGRFFMWVHYLDPHADYIPHKSVKSFGNSARDLYDAEVLFTDKHFGRLIDHIAKAPWADRTSIVVTSDHGEAFDEHNMYRHGVEVWEVLVRIPLVLHVPGVKPRRIAARRSHIGLVPTLLELARVPPPAGEGDDFLSGTSWLADLAEGAEPAVRDILVDMPAGPYNAARRAFIHDDLKLIISGGAKKELFDLASDPKEQKNVWRKRREEIEAHYAVMKSKLRQIEVKGKRR